MPDTPEAVCPHGCNTSTCPCLACEAETPPSPDDYERATGHAITSTAGYNDHCTCGSAGQRRYDTAIDTAQQMAAQHTDGALRCSGDDGLCDLHGYHRRPPEPEARTTPDNPPTSNGKPDNLRDRIAEAVQPLLMDTLPKPIAAARAQEVADTALHAIQGAYVPPPPGSDRDALPEDLRALIAPHMPEYVSTACQTALALDRASTIHLPSMTTLMDWERRQHNACRITRKQDMARCACNCHGPSAH